MAILRESIHLVRSDALMLVRGISAMRALPHHLQIHRQSGLPGLSLTKSLVLMLLHHH